MSVVSQRRRRATALLERCWCLGVLHLFTPAHTLFSTVLTGRVDMCWNCICTHRPIFAYHIGHLYPLAA